MKILVLCCCIIYYLFAYFIFIKDDGNNIPSSNNRLGTILWNNGFYPHEFLVENIYCYYSGSNAQSQSISGENIFKKVTSLDDCDGWYGITEMYESDDNSH
jgi:hypothetical protein